MNSKLISYASISFPAFPRTVVALKTNRLVATNAMKIKVLESYWTRQNGIAVPNLPPNTRELSLFDLSSRY